MIVNTKAYGKIEINDGQELYFSAGIMGFENLKNYALLDSEQQPFFWLQSLDVREIAFVLINPFLFRPTYNPKVADEDYKSIALAKDDKENTVIFTIVTIPDKSEDMTANLQGPIIINKLNKTAIQSICNNSEYQVKHRILSELSRVKDNVC